MAGGRKGVDASLLLSLACGATVENAARKAGVGERTVYRRLTDPEFHRQLEGLRAEMVQRTAAMLTAASMEAVKTLVALLDPSVLAAVRLGAARSVLELGARLRESAELEQRITALEEQGRPTSH
jgi:hypothetical protein